MPAQPMTDHDLLVVAVTKLDGLSASFAEVKQAVANKADVARVEKLETAFDAIRNKFYMATGALAVLQFLLRFFIK